MSEEDIRKSLKQKFRVAVEQYYRSQSLDVEISEEQLEDFVEHHATIQYNDTLNNEGSLRTIQLKAKRDHLIQARARKNRAKKAAKGGVGGGIAGFFGGGGAGAGIGALIGIIGGPIGVGIGLAIGAGVGASIGAVAGASGGGGIGAFLREGDNCKAEDVLPIMGRVIDNGDYKYIVVEVELNLPASTEPTARV